MRDLPRVYEELRNRVRIHIKQIRKSRKKHPEYAIALLIAVASEALSKLQGQKEHVVFARELLGEKHGIGERIGRALFEAVRHGLAHRYDTALIADGKRDMVVVIAWKKPDHHLHIVVDDWLDDGVRRPGVYLDMQTMWKELDSFFRRMTRRLHGERKLSMLMAKRGRWLEQRYAIRHEEGESVSEWQSMWADFTNQRLLPPR